MRFTVHSGESLGAAMLGSSMPEARGCGFCKDTLCVSAWSESWPVLAENGAPWTQQIVRLQTLTKSTGSAAAWQILVHALVYGTFSYCI
jgi:hypothetical protein